jgi:pyruvate ferredoxin oxidoreductase beta subunit
MRREFQDIYQTVEKEEHFLPGHLLCHGCPGGLLYKYIGRTLAPNTIISCGASCLLLPSMNFPNAITVPAMYISMASAASGLTGISAALNVLGRKGRLKKGERIIPIAIAGDGSACDIGFAALSGAAERNDDGIFFTYDNEAYMNTGNQRSSATPQYSWTATTPKGKEQRKKDMMKIMAAHNIPYCATISFAFPEDFIAKVQKAKAMEPGFKYFHTLAPCPTGWRFPEGKTVELSRLAVETGMWNLFEVDHGEFRLTYKPKKRRPVKEYLSPQGRFSHLTDQDYERIQKEVDEECKKLGI